jgi:hypothetical protein
MKNGLSLLQAELSKTGPQARLISAKFKMEDYKHGADHEMTCVYISK